MCLSFLIFIFQQCFVFRAIPYTLLTHPSIQTEGPHLNYLRKNLYNPIETEIFILKYIFMFEIGRIKV